jgi:hypothetical protein
MGSALALLRPLRFPRSLSPELAYEGLDFVLGELDVFASLCGIDAFLNSVPQPLQLLLLATLPQL